MTNPSWFEPPPKQETGCLKGCLFLIGFIIVGFSVLLGSVYYWGTHSHSAVARGIFWLTKIHAISEHPAAIPSVNVSASEREDTLERWRRFEQAAHAQQTAEIELTADDLNILIGENPDLDGKLFATIENDRLHLQLSFRLTHAIVRAAQYLNAQIVIEAPEPQPFNRLEFSRIHVNDAPIPGDLLEWKYGGQSLRDIVLKHAEASRVGSLQIRDGKLVLRSRND